MVRISGLCFCTKGILVFYVLFFVCFLESCAFFLSLLAFNCIYPIVDSSGIVKWMEITEMNPICYFNTVPGEERYRWDGIQWPKEMAGLGVLIACQCDACLAHPLR